MHLRNFSESKRQEEAFTLFLRYLKNKKYYKAIDMLSVYTFHQLNEQRILCLALEFRIYPLINALLNIEWIDVNLAGFDNVSPLHFAVMMNDSYIIDELLLQGADVDKVSFDGKSVLHYAVLESQLSTVLKLIPKVNDINHKDKQGNTALHFAVLSCSLDIVIALVNSGADVSATNNNGRTPAALMPNVLKQTSEIYGCLQTKK